MRKKRRYLAYRSFWPEPETTRKFQEAGFRTVCFLAGNTCNSFGEPYGKYPLIWAGEHVYEFEHLDQQISDILAAAPGAELICMIDLNTPFWYVRRHGSSGEGYDSFDQLGRVASSPRWRSDTAEYLEAFLRHAELRYAGQIKAYVLCGGATCEWIDRSRGEESQCRFEAYREYCIAHDLPVPSDIPPRSIRNHVTKDFLRDPDTDEEALHYWKFTNAEVSETVLFFLKKARAVLDELHSGAELGIFFGYILNMGMESWNGGGGHLDYETLFRAPETDFVISPAIYHDRDMGGGCGAQLPMLSLSRYGKQYLYECDQRTHSYNRKLSAHTLIDYPGFADERATLAGMKREFAFSLIHRCSMWFFDMWGGFYQGENVFSLLRSFSRIWERWSERPFRDTAEILLVVDPESMLYVDYTREDSYDYCVRIQAKLHRVGAPYRVCSFADLEWMAESGRLRCFKLVIMAGLFMVNEERLKILRNHLFQEHRTIVWQYLAGVVRNGIYAHENVTELTGISPVSDGVSVREMNGWRSVLARHVEDLTTELIRCEGEKAGVHFYADLPLIVYADGDFLAVHVGYATEGMFYLPEDCSFAEEVFSGKTFRSGKIPFHTDGVETYLFHLFQSVTEREKK